MFLGYCLSIQWYHVDIYLLGKINFVRMRNGNRMDVHCTRSVNHSMLMGRK